MSTPNKNKKYTSDDAKRKAWTSIIAFVVLIAIIVAILLLTLTKCNQDNLGDNTGGSNNPIGGGAGDVDPPIGGDITDAPCTHNIVIDQAVAPDCLNTGLTEGSHCSLCDAVIVAQTEIPALGHTVVDDPEVPADCLNAGLTAGSHCSVCGTTIVTQTEIPALGHEYSWVDNGDGTCTGTCANDSSHVETADHIDDNTDELCDNCGASMHVHQWGEWTFNPDGTTHTRVCLLDDSHTETGDHTGMDDCTCDVCGVVNHVTHDNNMTKCDKCGTTFHGYDFNVGDKIMIDHGENESNIMFDASYDNYGQIINTLSSEFSLDPNRYLLTVEAGAVDGSFAFKTPFGKYMAIDDEYHLVHIDEINESSSWTHSGGWAVMSNVKYPNALFGSSYEYDQYVIFVGSEPVAPKRVILIIVCIYNYSNVNVGHEVTYTDNGDGTHRITCSICGDISENEPCYGGTATCTDKATCTGCGAKHGEASHTNIVADNEVPATCTTTGLTAGSHCEDCGEVITAQTEIPALGHEYSWVDNGDGTCTGTCANDSSHVETADHIDDDADELCDNCGASMHVHQWGEWTFNPDGTTHTRVCLLDDSHVETADHTGMDDCTCDDCGYVGHTGMETDCTCDVCGVVQHYTHDGNIHLCDACGNPAFEILVENDQLQEGDKILIGNNNFGQSTGTANGNSFVYFSEVMDFSTEENLGYTVVLGGDSTEGFIDFDKYMLTVEVDLATGYYYFRTNFGKYLGIDESTALMYYENPNENARWRINSHGLGDANAVAYYSEIICVANGAQLQFTSNRRVVIPLIKVGGTAIQIFRGVNTGHQVTCRENGDGATHTINCSVCGDISTGECYGGTATCTEQANCIECGGKYGEVSHVGMETDCTCDDCGYVSHTGMDGCICDVCGFGNHVDSDDNIFDCEVCGGTIPFVNIDTEYLMDGVAVYGDQKVPHAPLQTGDKILMGHTDDYRTGTYVGMYLDFKNEENLGNMVKLGTDTTGLDNPEQYLLEVVKIGDNTYAFRTHFGKYVAMDENSALVYVDEINDYSTWALRSSAFGSDNYKEGLTELTNVATGSLLAFPEDPLKTKWIEKYGGMVLYVFRDINKE